MKTKVEDVRTPFHQVLRNMGYHSLAAKHGAPIRPAPTVDLTPGVSVRVTNAGTYAVLAPKATQFRLWRARKWD